MLSTLSLPITQDALRLLAAEAKANGVTVEEQAARLLESGYGVRPARVIERVLEDARNAIADAAMVADAETKRGAVETRRAA